MIGIVLVVAVAVAAAFKTPRGPIYWIYWGCAVAYFFVIGPALFNAQSGGFVPFLAIYGGTIGLLLLAIRDQRGTLRSPADISSNKRSRNGEQS